MGEQFGVPKISSAEESEKKRVEPLGYESIPPRLWISPEVQQYVDWWYAAAESYIPEMKKNADRGPYALDYDLRDGFEFLRTGMTEILLDTEFSKCIENQAYGVILGEDASGRIPTLLLSEVAKNIAKASGVQSPETKFCAGFRDRPFDEGWDAEKDALRAKWQEGLGDFFETFKQTALSGGKKKVLICTETISSGGSVMNIAEVLQAHDIDFDVVTYCETPRKESLFPGHKVFSGDLWSCDLDDDFRRNYKASGIWKKQGDVHARSVRAEEPDMEYKNNANSLSWHLKGMNQMDATNCSRKIVKYLGANMVQAYLDYKAGKFKAEQSERKVA